MIKKVVSITAWVAVAVGIIAYLHAIGVIQVRFSFEKRSIPIASSTKWADTILIRTNQERVKLGCPALIVNPELEKAAYERAEYLATFESIAEKGHEGWDRTVRKYFKYREAGENLAQGFPSESTMFDALMNSTTHRDNIVDCDYTVIGIGRAGDIVVQEFARPL